MEEEMLKNFIDLFKSDITVIKSTKRDSEILKKITKLYSEGNTNLQNGRYITSKEIKKKQKEIFSYKFAI
jgi:hypothetical protein